jgi:hypothetical protein
MRSWIWLGRRRRWRRWGEREEVTCGKKGSASSASPPSLRLTLLECSNRLDFERCRGYSALLPCRKRERYFRLACARLFGSPHGAVETVPSASLIQRHAHFDCWFASLPMRPFDLGNRVEILGKCIVHHEHERTGSASQGSYLGLEVELFAW